MKLRTSALEVQAAAPRAHRSEAAKPCGHVAHVGTCSACQRAQLAKWRRQLAQVEH